MASYFKSAVFDLVLTAAVSIALSYMALDGFYVADTLQHGVIPAIVNLVCLAALFAATQNKRSSVIGGLAYGFCLIAAWVVAGAATPGGGIFDDNESNYMIFVMVITLIPTLCFLLSRKRTGAAILFIVGVLFLALIQLLYMRFEILWTAVFVIASLALIIFKNYQLSLRTATTVRQASMLPGFCVALAVVALACGLGAGIWYGIIAPQNPDALEIKLITEYRSLETKQVVGTSDVYQIPNVDMTSKDTNNATRTTDDIDEDENGIRWPATGKEDNPDDQTDDNTFLGINMDSLQETFDMQSNPGYVAVLVSIIVVVLLLVAGYFVGRRLWRARRLKNLQAQGATAEFEGLFLFMMTRFKRLGITIPLGQTVREFGASSAAAMEPYNREANVDFGDLANVYSAMAYGKGAVDDDTVKKMEAFYGAFWKACRKQLGNLKYFFKAFRL